MSKHISVLKDEAIKLLDIKENGIYVDGTLGRGGHTEEILKRLKSGKLYCFDLDEKAIEESKQRLKEYQNVIYIHDNFMNMNKYVNKVDGILLDLGVSSPQFDEAERGFSYRFDGPLDMRMNKEQELTASKIINTYSEQELVRIFRDYGEEKNSRSIAKAIVHRRVQCPIETTLDLVEVIREGLPHKVLSKKGHPAKQCFQALRIAVNGELDSLSNFLNDFDQLLLKEGVCAIISFHSLEDRLVKQCFKRLSTVKDDLRIDKLPSQIETPNYMLLTRHAIEPSDSEKEENPRSKSAKLRAIKKVKD